jgi:hypothetical protein
LTLSARRDDASSFNDSLFKGREREARGAQTGKAHAPLTPAAKRAERQASRGLKKSRWGMRTAKRKTSSFLVFKIILFHGRLQGNSIAFQQRLKLEVKR